MKPTKHKQREHKLKPTPKGKMPYDFWNYHVNPITGWRPYKIYLT
jgi:hypothetical protein